MMASNESNEPFPPLPLTPPAISNPPHPVFSAKPAHSSSDPATHERRKSSSPSPSKRRRTSSLTQSFLNSSPPYGMWQATGEVASKIPTLGEIRNGSFSTNGWTKEGQMEARGENPHQIQGRRNSRASSLSTSRRRRSTTSPLSARSGEAEEYFPAAHVQLPEGPARVPSTIPEAPPLEGAKTNM